MRHVRTISITGTSRKSIRRELIDYFLEEEHGTGRGENCSHYDYTVETLSCGCSVHLRRPAPLNKGFDFIVYVPGIQFHIGRQSSVPSHPDIVSDIESKLIRHPELKEHLLGAIQSIYDCQNITQDMLEKLPCDVGVPIEVTLATIKWLFIEQDITYWNWTGRNMLYNKLLTLF